ncbi:hypothetical protein SGGMMB4_04525 [Sodalis glossinidius str. 'morsitans']|uniref:Uncharacterized protein n=1 Tax=Sodalis glossinidius (strain morsitans) TaxID=343509 RepID=A0A193QM20_SODGM|nr:hypothetical protein SGGMMB4_04525 [Sodalis glossinidius str. 'morsitans']
MREEAQFLKCGAAAGGIDIKVNQTRGVWQTDEIEKIRFVSDDLFYQRLQRLQVGIGIFHTRIRPQRFYLVWLVEPDFLALLLKTRYHLINGHHILQVE